MKRVRKNRGQAIVEFALIMPICVLLLAAVTDFGRYLVSSSECAALCQDVARYACQVHPVTGESRELDAVIERAKASPPSGVSSDDLNVVVDMDCNVAGHEAVSVTISFEVEPLTAVAQGFFPNGKMPVRSTGVFLK